MLLSVSIKTRTFAAVNTCNGSFLSCVKLLKQYRSIEQMCSDAHSITLNERRLFIHLSVILRYFNDRVLFIALISLFLSIYCTGDDLKLIISCTLT